MQGQLVLDLQIHVDGSGRAAGPHDRRDLAIRVFPGEFGQFLLSLWQIQGLALRHGGHGFLDVAGREILSAGDPHPIHGPFLYLEDDHTLLDVLLRNINQSRLIARLMIGFFQCGSGLLHIGQ